MIRKKSIKLIRFLFSRIIISYFGGIWSLKERLKKMTPSFLKSLLLSIYNKKIDDRNSYIGARSDIKSKPIFPHGINSVFISDGAIIGKGCIIFQQTTIGSNNLIESKSFGSPRLGNNVLVGAGAKIIGNVIIGDNCRIGANTIVYEDMPANSVAVMQSTVISTKSTIIKNRLYTQNETKEGLIWGYYDASGVWKHDEKFKLNQ